MALSILDGNQSATTLSTILSSGQHITAHTVVSLGTQAITDMRGAVSGSVVSISNFPSTQTIAGTVTANAVGYNYQETSPTLIPIKFDSSDTNYIPIGPSVDPIPLPISGTVTASLFDVTDPVQDNGTSGKTVAIKIYDSGGIANGQYNASPVFVGGTVTIGTALPTGTNRIGVVTIGAGTVTLGASTSQIGSVTASISGTVPISISSVTVGNSVTIASLPALVAGTAQIGSVTASISNSVTIASFATSVTARLINPAGTAVTYAEVGTAGNPSIDVLSVQGVTSGTPLTILNHQGTTVTTSNFTSTTASTVLASANTSREVLTIFNEGAGNLHICAGATCTTIAYQVRLSAGDYYEVPLNQTSLTHSAVFATAGTARIVQIS